MAIPAKNLDPAFQGAGHKDGIEIWRIEQFKPVPLPTDSYGKFYMGDSYIVLKTTALKNGSLRHDIHYWLGKDTSQDEAGTAAVKTVELDAALGGRAVQYREVQGNESEKFRSYFRPCIIPQPGGVASGFQHVETNEKEYVTRLYVCKGKHVVHVTEVPFARSSLNHDDVFILDTESKIFQFNGSNSCIQERAKALEVIQFIRETFHGGKCNVAAIEDGKLMADSDSGEFWGFLGGFAPLPRKGPSQDNGKDANSAVSLSCLNNGNFEAAETESLTKDLLETEKCYLLDSGIEVYVWMGKQATLEDRKSASAAAEKLVSDPSRAKSHVVRVIEGYETIMFKSKFDKWPKSGEVAMAEESGRGKVAALIKRQGFEVWTSAKASPEKEEVDAHIDSTGVIQVWRVNGKEKSLLPPDDQFKFYSGDCYVFQYTYPGDDRDEYLIGTWFGKKSVEEERTEATSLASKMVESAKFQAALACFYEGKEPIQFFVIIQSFVLYKGGLSSGYKNFITESGADDDTYAEDGVALFRIQGTGPDNMQAIQVDPVASSLNSLYCYILHEGSTVYTWYGNQAGTIGQELCERLLDIIKPNVQAKKQKEGTETDQFWSLLGGKIEYSSQKIAKQKESDPHLFACNLLNGDLKVKEIHHFTQDDLMTEDVYILDCRSSIYIWIGQLVDAKLRAQALTIGEKFLKLDFLMENLSHDTPIFVVTEGSEPPFFTHFFTWDPAKSLMEGNSYERKLAIVKDGITPSDKPKRRAPVLLGAARSGSVTDVPQQRSRSVSSFSPDRPRSRGRSPALNALAASFENANRNLSTPPPLSRKSNLKLTPDSENVTSKSETIAAISSAFERPTTNMIPRSLKASPASPSTPDVENSKPEGDSTGSPMSLRIESINEDATENEPENEEGLVTYPYERLKVDAENPAEDIDVTKRETYLSAAEFKEKFGMAKDAFAKLPKWKQNRLKIALQLF